MGLFDVLDDLFDRVTGIFGGDDDGRRMSMYRRPRRGAATPPGAPPVGAGSASAEGPQRATAGRRSGGNHVSAGQWRGTQTDDKLAGLLKQIFAANDETRSKISGIVSSIETARRALMSNPQMANDPHAMALFNQFLDGPARPDSTDCSTARKWTVRSRLSCLPRWVMSTAAPPAGAIPRSRATTAAAAAVAVAGALAPGGGGGGRRAAVAAGPGRRNAAGAAPAG